MKVPVGVSKKHVHLTKDVCIKLFGSDELPVRNYLNQPGQYASTLTVDLEWNGNVIPHVRVVGPLRNYNQIELSDNECNILKVNPPRRQSGDLDGSLPIILIGPNGKVNLDNGLIRAERHIHMTPDTMKELNLIDKQEVLVYKNDKYLFNAKIKLSDPGFNELHIDTVEEAMYDLHQGEEVTFKCGK